jgi:hypothetical protein
MITIVVIAQRLDRRAHLAEADAAAGSAHHHPNTRFRASETRMLVTRQPSRRAASRRSRHRSHVLTPSK